VFSIRLPKELERMLESLSREKQVSKSEIVREALQEYMDKKKKEEYPYLLGEDLFGMYGSSSGSKSVEYKKIVREKIHAKNPD
jgi:metal-responsive CopG/Arc/MetJ family transcriptional regulator